MCDPCCGVNCTPFCDPCEQFDRKPRELKGGIYTKCDCTYRNGLQDSCLREDCKRPKRERAFKQSDNSFDIERTISQMTQPQSIQMPQHITMSKLGNGSTFNGLNDYNNQSGGMTQMIGSPFLSPQSFPYSQQLNMNNLSPQYSSQEPQTFMPSPQTYNGVPENSIYSSMPAADGSTLSPTGMGAMGLNNMFNSMGNGMGNNMGNGMGNGMAGMNTGMPTMTSYNGGMGGGNNMSALGNMAGLAGLSGMNGMAGLGNMANMANIGNLGNLGNLSGMGGSGGMNNLGGGGMGGGMSGGMGGGMGGAMLGGMSGGATYQSFPQMTGFGDGQQTMSPCY